MMISKNRINIHLPPIILALGTISILVFFTLGIDSKNLEASLNLILGVIACGISAAILGIFLPLNKTTPRYDPNRAGKFMGAALLLGAGFPIANEWVSEHRLSSPSKWSISSYTINLPDSKFKLALSNNNFSKEYPHFINDSPNLKISNFLTNQSEPIVQRTYEFMGPFWSRASTLTVEVSILQRDEKFDYDTSTFNGLKQYIKKWKEGERDSTITNDNKKGVVKEYLNENNEETKLLNYYYPLTKDLFIQTKFLLLNAKKQTSSNDPEDLQDLVLVQPSSVLLNR